MARTVVVGVDGSVRSQVALDWAVQEARLRDVPLYVVHVAPHCDQPLSARLDAQLTAPDPAAHAKSALLVGAALPVLLALGRSAEMLVLGVRGAGGHAGLAVGSVAHGVASASVCPVALVPAARFGCVPERRPDRVTLGIDARDPADRAIDFALAETRLRGARLHALHAWSYPATATASPLPIPVSEHERATWEDQEVQLLSDALRPWREKYAQVHVLEDVVRHSPADALLRASARAELLAVGRRRDDGLGPAVDRLVQHGQCPVVVVPS
ncbi:universal stress protein [Streptomyces sp. NPDC050095]|uniref:universal stress protein n=1 Tax=unclassified Streptomyces TaxID=2593676 RepID=UPI00343B3B9C